MSFYSFVLPNLDGGGAERMMITLARELTGLGHRVEIVLMQAQGELLEGLEEQICIYDLAVQRTRSVPAALKEYLQLRKPDFLVANMWPLTVLCSLTRLFSQHRPKLMLIEHNNLTQQYSQRGWLFRAVLRASIAAFYRMADIRVAVSRGLAGHIATLGFMRADSFKALYNPLRQVPARCDVDLEPANALWDQQSAARFLAAGSFKTQKNFTLLLQAFQKVRQTLDAQLVILGDGAQREMLQHLAGELGIEKHVHMPGFFAEPFAFFYTADVFVLSSDYEGFGNVIQEALACGLNVVSTDCDFGPAEILQQGRCGALVPVGDAEALAQAMQKMVQNPMDETLLKARADAFSAQRYAQSFIELFESA